jgi:CelD/BcsL family acetyltransferase involved in cellulose biosynthesis
MAILEASVIRDLAGVQALAGEWDGLLSRSASPEVFRTYEWLTTWWEVFGASGGRQPLVVVVRQGRTLVGLAPFVVRDVGRGRARVRRLELMGTGEDKTDEVCSYFGDIIAATGFEEAVCDCVWRCLQSERSSWDEAVWGSILESSLIARYLRPRAHDHGHASTGSTFGRRFWVDLSGGNFNGFLEGLSKKRRTRLQSYRRKLEKEGVVEELVTAPEQIPGFLAEIARLNRLRRGSQGRGSAWESEKFRRFHELLAPRLLAQGRLDLRLWKRDGQCLAALYHFVYAGTVYGYQIGFDTAAFGSVSPGLVTISQSIEWAFAQGLRRFDFLVSGDGSYKEDYPCQTEAVMDATVYNDTLAGQLMRFARQARTALSELRARVEAVRTPKPVPAPAPAAEAAPAEAPPARSVAA